jgi:hypothetical protein
MLLTNFSFNASLAYRFYCRGRCRELITGTHRFGDEQVWESRIKILKRAVDEGA